MQLRHAGLHGVISNKLYSGSNAMVAEWEICETRTVVEKHVEEFVSSLSHHCILIFNSLFRFQNRPMRALMPRFARITLLFWLQWPLTVQIWSKNAGASASLRSARDQLPVGSWSLATARPWHLMPDCWPTTMKWTTNDKQQPTVTGMNTGKRLTTARVRHCGGIAGDPGRNGREWPCTSSNMRLPADVPISTGSMSKLTRSHYTSDTVSTWKMKDNDECCCWFIAKVTIIYNI